MSSATRDQGIVRRLASFPRSIMGEFSRAFDDGMSFMGRGRRRNQQVPSSFQVPILPQSPEHRPVLPDEWAFLESFEQQYSTTHPFFYACRFMEALKLAEQDKKFMFMYLHSPEQPFTHIFCSQTLCSELVTQFLDVNFVCWGALADRGEGLRMVATLRPSTFPCCAIIAPAPGDTITVLQQIEGPVSPAELVAILQRTMEEQGVAFGIAQPKHEENIRARRQQEEKIRADRQLREEQDAAYLAALQMDKEKERLKNLHSREKVQAPAETSATRNYEKLRNNSVSKQPSKVNELTSTTKENQFKGIATRGGESQPTQILIRFPNGERREQSFLCTDKIQSIFTYIDSLGLQGIGNYRLVSNFPRRVYGVDQMRMTLKDAGLHPKASLFLEPV
ncbi:hypothetical protein L6164_011041 [Bauhinia variegata]|uniref:Uncharacterized protein n=1 Tax=Bauhinia variegata TaxID=167791 RepID=A0ACB9P8H7_BAUVA|nr:hypothetical protein L6164_011041 [Bauhinia variegata]